MPRFKRPDRKKKKADEEVKLWKRRLASSEARLKRAGSDPRGGGEWREWINLFRGQHWKKGEGGDSNTFHRITSNLVKSNIDALRPQLYFQNPKVKISLKNPEITTAPLPISTGEVLPPGTPIATIGGEVVNAQEQIDLLEAIDNYYLREMGAKRTMKRIINDALVLPYGVGKLEFQIETEMVEVVLERDPDTQEPTKVTQKESVLSQKPSFERIKPWKFLMDSELDELDIDNAGWVAEVKFMSHQDLMDDPMLDNTKLKDLGKPEFEVGSEIEPIVPGSDDDTEEFKRYKVYEIHDLKNNKLIVWVSGSEKFQRNETHPYSDVEGAIYMVLGFDEDIDSPFPIALPKQIKSKVKARNWILSAMTNHISRFNRKYKSLKNIMEESEKEKFLKGEDGTMIEVSSMAGGPEPIKDAGVSVDMYNLEGILKREITEEIGVSAMNRASREPGVETATEADFIQSGADVKTEEKRDAVKDFMMLMIRKLNQIIRGYVDEPIVQEIVGANKATKWVKWTKRDIQGEFVEDVDIYSGMPFSIQVDRRQALEMFSLVGQDPHYNPIKVRQELSKRMNWPDDILNNPQETQQLAQDANIQAALQNQRKGESTQTRPQGAPGETAQRQPDILASILGQAAGG